MFVTEHFTRYVTFDCHWRGWLHLQLSRAWLVTVARLARYNVIRLAGYMSHYVTVSLAWQVTMYQYVTCIISLHCRTPGVSPVTRLADDIIDCMAGKSDPR